MPTATPRFSVTIPAYNATTTLPETIASVRAQTFSDFEVVICDDGSTDSTLEMAREFASQDPRIRVITQENRGSGGAYNTAVREARSDLLVMLSADDLLLPEHLASMDAFIRSNPDASIYTCDGYYLYEDGRRERVNSHTRWSDPSGATLRDILVACFYGIGAVYRRSVFDSAGGFREDVYAEDYPFWLTAMAHGHLHRHLDAPLSIHRRHSAQKSSDALRVRKADSNAVGALIDSGVLSGADLDAARAAKARLDSSIRLRRVLSRVVGATISERLIALTREMRLSYAAARARSAAKR